jgi:hypothetical protein
MKHAVSVSQSALEGSWMAIHKIRPKEPTDLSRLRQTMLELVEYHSRQGSGYFQSKAILNAVAEQLNAFNNPEAERAILTLWHDLLRGGLIAPGCDLANPDLPFLHLTASGRKALENVSRDPSNPDGYIAHLRANGLHDPIVTSYIKEAVLAYNATCYKSAAVMVGSATERYVVLIRDELVGGLARRSRAIVASMNDWRYKTVRDAVGAELDANRSDMPNRLRESYSAFWVPLTEQPRLYRNDAGHPQSVDPVTPEVVHSNLLIFPEFSVLAKDLVSWIQTHYV